MNHPVAVRHLRFTRLVVMKHHQLSMTLAALTLLAGSGVLLSGCTNDEAQAMEEDSPTVLAQAEPSADASAQSEAERLGNEMILHDLLANHHLSGLDARGIIETIGSLPINSRPTDLTISVHTDALYISDATGANAHLDMPADETYMAFGPFEDHTSNCSFHRVTTDLAELPNEVFDVRVIDDASGSDVLHQAVTTKESGFFGLWLPREKDMTIQISRADGKSAVSKISTHDGAPTCDTTLRLH